MTPTDLLALPRTEAYMWWCEDEDCNCTQPVVERVDANPEDCRFVRRTRLWEGSFRSDAEPEERKQQEDELAEARKRFGLEAK